MTLEELLNERDQQLIIAKQQINELQSIIDELQETNLGVRLTDSEKMMLDIIHREVKRLNDSSIEESLDRNQIKHFDVLVKDFVAIRGKIEPSKSKEIKDESDDIADLIALATGE